MPSDKRRAAARRRAWGRGPIILRFEPLEGRQLLSAQNLPDLVGDGFVASVHNLDWGDSLTVAGKILNQGKAAVNKSFNVEIIASTTPTIQPGSGFVLGTFSVPAGLGPNQIASYNEKVTLPPTPIPGFSGNPVYITSYVSPGRQVTETNYRNNYSIGMNYDTTTVAITPQQPSQLTGTGFSVNPNATAWGQQVTVSAQIVNNAQGNAPATRAAIELTPLGVTPGTGQDVTLGYISIPAVPAWQTTNVVQTFTLPATAPAIFGTATQFTISMVQDVNYQTNPIYPHAPTQGNGLDLSQITIAPGPVSTANTASPPDLAAGTVAAPTNGLHWGMGFPVTATVQNVGQGVAGPFNVVFVLTNPTGSSAAAIYLGSAPIAGLAAGASRTISTTLMLPQRLPSGISMAGIGTGRIAMLIDPENVVNETTTANNLSYSNPVVLRLLGADGTSAVPTSPAPVLGQPQPAGNLTPTPGLTSKLTPAQRRSQRQQFRRLHLRNIPEKKSLAQKVEDRLKVFPQQIGDAFKDLFS
jgi:hypothetical protein